MPAISILLVQCLRSSQQSLFIIKVAFSGFNFYGKLNSLVFVCDIWFVCFQMELYITSYFLQTICRVINVEHVFWFLVLPGFDIAFSYLFESRTICFKFLK